MVMGLKMEKMLILETQTEANFENEIQPYYSFDRTIRFSFD